ncbi:polyhydroxyalkanoate synthesis repressor PhaR [Sphingomonas mesophila]|uniref:polyhydroxyalkanoate synthesis repressor PhaR n=1 Tax=Sphingomonas mesophila TaxID=2303576 RepID=UPI000E57692B|nr:polyhydroxyalkanoate synthesis repressor PhaR [Sphingomonas mesophila]
MAKGAAGSTSADKVTIKKYANRRLYDTESSSYITLDKLAGMIRDGRDFEVVDAKTGEDITHQILTQIIVDEEARGQTMLPVNFLRQLIGMYGGKLEAQVPQYLEAAMEAFEQNQKAMAGVFTPSGFADLAKRNMAMFQEAGRAFTAGTKAAAPAGDSAEVAALKAQLAELQAKVDKLAK